MSTDKLTIVFPMAAIALIALCYAACVPGFVGTKAKPLRLEDCGKYRLRDLWLAGGLTVLYAMTAFFQLGLDKAPQNYCVFTDWGDYVTVELPEARQIGELDYFPSLHTGAYRLQFSPDGEEWIDQVSMEQGYADLFKWKKAELQEDNPPVRWVRIISDSELWLGEIALRDEAGRLLSTGEMIFDGGAAPLFDEQDTVPEEESYLNSTYFDEIYHARTAYEHIKGVYPYEVSHPPLGKILLSLGIRLFGMTPFGWRFMGVFFGVLMVPAMYVFGKTLFGGYALPFSCAAIFAFDFMHFTQTRIATIDTYAVFFILLMYLFMYLYLASRRTGETGRREWLPWLALSGVSFGLGAASKWTCIYAGAGLGVLWLADRLIRAWRAYRPEPVPAEEAGPSKTGKKEEDKPTPAQLQESISNTEGIRAYWKETRENVLWCLLFFVLVPAAVYYVSYLPYGRASGLKGPGMLFTGEYARIVLDNQRFMFTYHAGVTATHPYSSHWYQWLLDIRPILYYLHYFGDGTRSSFGAFVNPMLCWGGLAAMVLTVWRAIRFRDGRAAFIAAGYLAQLLPWVLVPRITFAYHYFPCTVFLVAAVGNVFFHRPNTGKRMDYWPLAAFTAVSVILFAAFYPVLSGTRVSESYCAAFLRWLPSTWPF